MTAGGNTGGFCVARNQLPIACQTIAASRRWQARMALAIRSLGRASDAESHVPIACNARFRTTASLRCEFKIARSNLSSMATGRTCCGATLSKTFVGKDITPTVHSPAKNKQPPPISGYGTDIGPTTFDHQIFFCNAAMQQSHAYRSRHAQTLDDAFYAWKTGAKFHDLPANRNNCWRCSCQACPRRSFMRAWTIILSSKVCPCPPLF